MGHKPARTARAASLPSSRVSVRRSLARGRCLCLLSDRDGNHVFTHLLVYNNIAVHGAESER
jgi:hypothetical protein